MARNDSLRTWSCCQVFNLTHDTRKIERGQIVLRLFHGDQRERREWYATRLKTWTDRVFGNGGLYVQSGGRHC